LPFSLALLLKRTIFENEWLVQIRFSDKFPTVCKKIFVRTKISAEAYKNIFSTVYNEISIRTEIFFRPYVFLKTYRPAKNPGSA
jgi:hypothetical protein